jgi:hypothetical protein
MRGIVVAIAVCCGCSKKSEPPQRTSEATIRPETISLGNRIVATVDGLAKELETADCKTATAALVAAKTQISQLTSEMDAYDQSFRSKPAGAAETEATKKWFDETYMTNLMAAFGRFLDGPLVAKDNTCPDEPGFDPALRDFVRLFKGPDHPVGSGSAP